MRHATMMTMFCALVAGTMLVAEAAAGTATNSTAVADGAPLTPEMRKARARAKIYQRTGGWVRRPGTGRGKCVIVNTQKRIPAEPFAKAASEMTRMLHVDIVLADGEPVTVQGASMGLLKSGGQAAVFIVDDASLPALLVAPESRWAMVNAAALTADKASDTTVATRAMREACRAFAQLAGASNSSVPVGCVMRPVNSLRDLDALTVDCFCPEPIQRMVEHLETLGIEPFSGSIYRSACMQGWAPAPTNDVQKAIWEKVQAEKERGPTNPITIQPPKKK